MPIPTKKTVWRWLVPAALFYALAFAAAGAWDFAINTALYTPRNPFAIFMECFGWYPAFLPTLLLAALLAARQGFARQARWQRVLCAAIFAVGLFALCSSSYGSLLHRGLAGGLFTFAFWAALAAGLVCAAGLWLAAWRAGAAVRKKLVFFALMGSALMLANQVLVNALKILWARTRFDDMLALGSFEWFTPWYLPMGYGGTSFPSGHTANAAGIFALLVLCDVFPAWQKHRRLVLALCWVWVGAMAFARVLIGRHYLSDTLAASAMMALIFYALRHNPFYRQALQNTLGGGGSHAV